jgi:hypothetical protein
MHRPSSPFPRCTAWTALLFAFGLVPLACSSGGTASTSHTQSSSSASGGAAASSGASTGGPSGSGGATTGSSSGTGAGGSTSGGGGTGPGGLRWIGRVDASTPTAAKFAWSGSGLVAIVNGAKISVQLQTEAGASSTFFQAVIDGTPGQRFQVMAGAPQTVVLGMGLAAADHTVELYRDTEGMYGDSVFLGFVDGTVKGAPPYGGRLLEVVGDSISAGYGNLGNEVHPPWNNTCTFSLDTEAAYQSYASFLGRTLGAEVSILARSGWGMYRDNGGSTAGVLSSVYGDTVGTESAPTWDFARKADAVLINLGTNDSAQGDPGQPYEDAYVAFLKTVRGHYANAWIFMTMGPMTADPLLAQMRMHLANVLAKVTGGGDMKVTTIDLATQDTTMTGCDYHPNVAEDQKMAAALAPAIKAKLGW